MVQYMNTGKPFSLVYVTYDVAKGKGGSVKRVAQAVKHWAIIANEAAENAAIAGDLKRLRQSIRNPRHFENGTTNIRVTAAGGTNDIRKVHIQLIRNFNGLIVK